MRFDSNESDSKNVGGQTGVCGMMSRDKFFDESESSEYLLRTGQACSDGVNSTFIPIHDQHYS